MNTRNYGEEGEMDKKEKAKKDKKEQKEEGNTGEGKVSVVVTVKDDPVGERKLMEALAGQTVRPDEVVVVRAEEYGNCSRGKGRNIGVRMARNEVIAVTDAGCTPHKDWLGKLIASFQLRSDLPRSDLGRSDLGKLAVAGGYRAAAKTDLQRIIGRFLTSENPSRGPYKGPTLPRQGRTLGTGKGRAFLPASRSIMFTKAAWAAVGGYPEEAVSGGEDLEFSRRLVRHPEVKMIYCPQALVDWEPPATLGEFFRDIVKHTRGNVEVGYWPHLIKNFTVVLRWMVFLTFPWMIPIYLIITWLYKGSTLPRQGRTLAWLPIVQLAADFGVIWGIITKIANVDCIKVRPCRGKVGPSRRI